MAAADLYGETCYPISDPKGGISHRKVAFLNPVTSKLRNVNPLIVHILPHLSFTY